MVDPERFPKFPLTSFGSQTHLSPETVWHHQGMPRTNMGVGLIKQILTAKCCVLYQTLKLWRGELVLEVHGGKWTLPFSSQIHPAIPPSRQARTGIVPPQFWSNDSGAARKLMDEG